MGNAVYKLLTEQARESPPALTIDVVLVLTQNHSPKSGRGENGTPGCRGENDTRITKPGSIII